MLVKFTTVERLSQVQPEIESLKEVVASLKRHIDNTERHVNTSVAPAHRAIRHLMVRTKCVGTRLV